jgi:NAD(P)H-hydrate epimerase
MASGGMGDVLSGIIGGLLAQDYAPDEACCLGVFLHGAAADIFAQQHGQAGLLARDVIDNLPDTLRALSRAGQVDAQDAYDSDILG